MVSEICRTFMDNIFLESEVEKLKMQLSFQADFTCDEAFKVFNPHNTSN